jgi:outer membrane cobalamin receptor
MILWQPNFQFIWSPSNFDVTRNGWDLNGRASIPRVGVDASASFSRTDVRYAGPVLQGQVAYRPRSTANGSLSATRWGVRLEANTRYIGVRRTVIGSALNSLESYTLTDARLSRSIVHRGWHTDVSVGVENAFDRSASMLVDYPFPGRTWTVSLRTRRTEAAPPRTSRAP